MRPFCLGGRWAAVFALASIMVLASTDPGAAVRHAQHRKAAVRASQPQPLRLTIELQPTELILDQGKEPSGDLVLVAHNPGPAPVISADVHFLAPVGVTVVVTSRPTLPSSGDLVWAAKVTATELAPATAKLVAELTYADNASGVPEAIATAAASINQPAPLNLAGAVKSSLAPSEGAIDRFTPLGMHLHFDNTSQRTIIIDNIRLLSPPYARIDGSVSGPFRVEPEATLSVPLSVRTSDTIVPGTYAMVLDYSVTAAGRPDLHVDATVQGKLNIGVPGLSDAMQFIGIPSLLLLPGPLTILTLIAAVAVLTRTTQLDWKNPGLLVVAATLSFGYAYLYPTAVERLVGQRRDYLRGYDLEDVVYLWAGSIAIGLAIALLFATAYWLVIAGRLWRRSRVQPSPADEPIDILRKMSLHGADFRMAQLRRRPEHGGMPAPESTVLALPFGTGPPELRWVVWQAILQPTNRPKSNQRFNEVRAVMDVPANARADTARLWRTVRKGIRLGEITLMWPQNGVTPGQVTDADYVGGFGTANFLRPE